MTMNKEDEEDDKKKKKEVELESLFDESDEQLSTVRWLSYQQWRHDNEQRCFS
jgi:hypothetical protein